MEFLEKLLENRKIIEQEPTAFIIIAVVCGLIGFMIARLLFQHRLMVADQHIRFKDDQLADFRERTRSTTPDQAGKRLEALELRIDKLEAELQGTETDFVAIYEKAKRGE